jgi:hypothetical protein
MGELVDMASQFRGLPMSDLIGGPLNAACDAQIRLASATADFIRQVGFLPAPAPAEGTPSDPNAVGETRTATFNFRRPVPAPTADDPHAMSEEDVELKVPLLAIVKVPNLAITTVDITFDMEVKSSFMEKTSDDKSAKFAADAEYNLGIFSVKVHVEGSVATHKENTRSSDNSAKYTVSVHAEDSGMPEGLARVLDILHSAIVPVPSGPKAIEDKKAA